MDVSPPLKPDRPRFCDIIIVLLGDSNVVRDPSIIDPRVGSFIGPSLVFRLL